MARLDAMLGWGDDAAPPEFEGDKGSNQGEGVAAHIKAAAVGASSAHRHGCHHGSHAPSLLEPALDGGAVVDAAVQARDGRLLRERREGAEGARGASCVWAVKAISAKVALSTSAAAADWTEWPEVYSGKGGVVSGRDRPKSDLRRGATGVPARPIPGPAGRAGRSVRGARRRRHGGRALPTDAVGQPRTGAGAHRPRADRRYRSSRGDLGAGEHRHLVQLAGVRSRGPVGLRGIREDRGDARGRAACSVGVGHLGQVSGQHRSRARMSRNAGRSWDAQPHGQPACGTATRAVRI
jgi:hypothetical protein